MELRNQAMLVRRLERGTYNLAMPPTPQERERFGAALRRLRGDRTISEIVTLLVRDHDLESSTAQISAWERGQYAPRHRSVTEQLDEALRADGELVQILYGPTPEPDDRSGQTDMNSTYAYLDDDDQRIVNELIDRLADAKRAREGR